MHFSRFGCRWNVMKNSLIIVNNEIATFSLSVIFIEPTFFCVVIFIIRGEVKIAPQENEGVFVSHLRGTYAAY